MRRAALAAIERKLFIHDPNWQRLANRKLMGATNRLPEHPQVTPGQSSRSGVNEIVKIHRRGHNSLSRPGLSSERATEPLCVPQLINCMLWAITCPPVSLTKR